MAATGRHGLRMLTTSIILAVLELNPPLELIDYLKPPVYYNTEEIQPRNQVFCGHLCLYILKHLTLGKDLQKIINNLY